VKRFRKVTNLRLNPFKEEIDNKMKGKIKLLGHIGLVLFLVSALMLMVAPVTQAATAVTNVWVQFLTSTYNTEGAAAQFTIHFTPTTALSRGVDTITVWFPDGSTAMGPDNFDLSSAETTAAYYEVDPDGEVTTNSAVECTYDEVAVLSTTGYRITVTTPVDLAAGTPCSLLIEDDANVVCADSTSRLPYYLKVYTSKDTTPVASDAFNLDTTYPDAMTVALTPDTAGTAGQYTFTIDLGDTLVDLPVGQTVTIIFPYGTTIPSSIAAENVKVSTDGGTVYESCTTAPTIDQKSRMITITTPVLLDNDDSNNIVRFLTAANIKNPETATDYEHYYVCTSYDERLTKATSAVTVDSHTATKLGFDNDAYPGQYSDSSTMVDMYSYILYLQVQDQYGNLVDNLTSEPTVSFTSSHASTGLFFSTPGTQISSSETTSGALSIYYRDSVAGTVTITASATGYTSGTWTMYIAPGVELYDSSNNLIKTYKPSSTTFATEGATVHSGDYIQDAINAAVTGDTVKLGGSSDAPAVYEVDTVISLSKKITLTSANGAAYTTLKPYADDIDAINVTVTGTATNPVIIDGLTFDRQRYDVEFGRGVYNNGYNYVTVRNCVFNYMFPEEEADHENGNVVCFIIYTAEGGGGAAITSGTISNNTFNNCGTFKTTALPGIINVFVKSSALTITGVTVSGNTLTNCNGYGIAIKGHYSNEDYYVTANVTDNTVTNGVNPISVQGYTESVNILRNTVTGGYQVGIYAEATDHDSLVIKNNTITGCAGVYGNCALRLDADGDTTAGVGTNVVQYNAIYDNDAAYSIYVPSNIGAQDCKYNWFGDATGPYYSALPGATVSKSNTGGAGNKVSDYVTYYPWLHKSLTDVVNDNASYQACTMSLVSGWNTLSTPVKLISTADSIDELIPAHMSVGYYYDGGWQQITTGYTLSPCGAVYVKMSVATDVLLKFDASAYTNPSKDLDAGWNLVSLAYLSSSGKDADDAMASVYQTAAGLPGYSQIISPSLNATQTNMFGVAGTSWAHSSGQSTAGGTMYAGLGYWCYMLNAATLAGFEITPIAPDLD
jgi:hypothetical protein